MLLFSLILMRMSGFILLNPYFGRKQVPNIVKAGMILTLTLCVYSFSMDYMLPVYNVAEYTVLGIKEFIIGFFLGFIMNLFSMVVTYAGAVVDFQMGLSMATIYDPQSNAQVSVTGTVWNIYYMLLFFAVDGHLALMRILLTSGRLIPYGQVVITLDAYQEVLTIFNTCILLAVKLAIPIISIEFITEIAAGILMKTIPQINIFVINIQLKVVVGLAMLLFLFSPMSDYIGDVINEMLNTLQHMLRIL